MRDEGRKVRTGREGSQSTVRLADLSRLHACSGLLQEEKKKQGKRGPRREKKSRAILINKYNCP